MGMVEETPEAETVRILKELIHACKDTEKGFQLVAGEFKNAGLNQVCEMLSRERNLWSMDLNKELLRLGALPVNVGTVGDNIRREWKQFTTLMQDDRDAELMEECMRGEDRMEMLYQQALRAALPIETQSMVESHYEKIQKTKALFDNQGAGLGITLNRV